MLDIVRHRSFLLPLAGAAAMLLLAACRGLPHATAPVELTANEQQLEQLLNNLLIGELYGLQGDAATAGDYYYRAALLTEDTAIVARAAGIALWDKNYALAERAARRWMVLNPDDPHPPRVLAVALALRGQVEQAVEAYSVSLGSAPTTDDFAAVQTSLAVPGMEALHLPIWRRLAERYPDSAAAGYHHALAAAAGGELEEARTAIRTVVVAKPDWTLAVVQEFEILRRVDSMDEAIARLREALTQQPEDEQKIRQLLADALLQAERHSEARTEYRALIADDADHPNWRFALGIIAILEQDWQTAREHFMILHGIKRPLRPKHGEELNRSIANYFLGMVEEQEGNFAQALERYALVEERDYVHIFGTEDYYQRARLRSVDIVLRTEDLAAARTYLGASRSVSAGKGSQILFYLFEATLLQEAEQMAESEAVLTEALGRFADNERLLYQRALLYGAMERYDDLERDLLAVLAKQPDHPQALNALGYTWADLNRNLEQALDYIQRAHEQMPEDAAILDSLGWAHFRLGDLEQAEHWLRKAYAQRTGDGEILAHLIEVVWVRGDHGEARRMYREAVAEMAPNRFLERLAGRFAL